MRVRRPASRAAHAASRSPVSGSTGASAGGLLPVRSPMRTRCSTTCFLTVTKAPSTLPGRRRSASAIAMRRWTRTWNCGGPFLAAGGDPARLQKLA